MHHLTTVRSLSMALFNRFRYRNAENRKAGAFAVWKAFGRSVSAHERKRLRNSFGEWKRKVVIASSERVASSMSSLQCKAFLLVIRNITSGQAYRQKAQGFRLLKEHMQRSERNVALLRIHMRHQSEKRMRIAFGALRRECSSGSDGHGPVTSLRRIRHLYRRQYAQDLAAAQMNQRARALH